MGGEGKREVDAEWNEERCVFVCLCVSKKKMKLLTLNIYLKRKKEKHYVREDTVCRGKNEV